MNVLSTTTKTPWRCAIAATLRISTRDRVGFDGVSIHTSLVSFGRISFSTSNSKHEVNDTSTPCAEATLVKYLCVPPYTSETETTCEPGAKEWRSVAVVAEPEEKAKAYFACSRAATASSKLSLVKVSIPCQTPRVRCLD